VQGGCPRGDGSGGPGYTIRAEFNDTPHVEGVVSMARGSDPHSAGSQFFIVQGEARYLDSRYTAFAKVVDGLDVVAKIAAVPVVENRYREASTPRDPVFINRIVLEGIEFDAADVGEPRPADGGAGDEADEAEGEGRGGPEHDAGDEEPGEGPAIEPRAEAGAERESTDGQPGDEAEGHGEGEPQGGGEAPHRPGGRGRRRGRRGRRGGGGGGSGSGGGGA
jgi:hypothetical protein